MEIDSGFAILDVKKGRKSLLKHFMARKGNIRVLIEADITGQWSHDDGVSIEFELDVKSVTVKE
jgi:hypothetical protein